MSGEEADGSKPHQGGVYGTFQGPPSYPPPRPPPVGFPQPAPPPGLSAYHRGGYQAVSARDYEAVCEDIAMIDFPVVALVLAGSCSYSVSSLVPFPGTLEPFCYGVPELITGRNQAMSHAQ